MLELGMQEVHQLLVPANLALWTWTLWVADVRLLGIIKVYATRKYPRPQNAWPLVSRLAIQVISCFFRYDGLSPSYGFE